MGEPIKHSNRMLICSVGGSPAPVAKTLAHWQPVKVWFVPTEQSRKTIEHDGISWDGKPVPSILNAARAAGFSLDAGRYDIHELSDGEDFAGCVRELQKLTGEVERWVSRGEDYHVVVDFTGGTKCMTAALSLQASRWPCNFSAGYSVTAQEAKDVPESLLMEIDGEVETSVFGDVAWSRHCRALFADELFTPLSKKVRISAGVQDAFDGLEAAQRVQVNEALDEFSAYLDDKRELLKSRTFKKLKGNPVPGSTHELYAWSEGAAGRLFGHFDREGGFVFDQRLDHL